MNRRGLLGALAAAAASAVLDPDRALWVAGAKRFFIPAPRKVSQYYDPVSGMAWRFVSSYDVPRGLFITRIEAISFERFSAAYPVFAARITG